MNPIVELRQSLSTTFGESPTADDMGVPSTSAGNLDFSVCFAAGGNWSLDGQYYDGDWKGGNGLGNLDWFALALALGGLRLNTFDDVDAKVSPNQYAIRLLAAQRQDNLEHAEREHAEA